MKDAFRITEEVLGDLAEEGKGIMFAVPVMYVKGEVSLTWILGPGP